MTGETNLKTLLGSITPALVAGDYVFCTVENAGYGALAEAAPIASFLEAEGLTLVLQKQTAMDQGLPFDGTFSCISLGVNSSLQAVGLTAAVTAELAANGIGANVMAAYFRDYIFVQSEFSDVALGILSKLSKNNL